MFKETKLCGYSVKYNLRESEKYWHFKYCMNCSSITKVALRGVIFDSLVEEIVFTNFLEALKILLVDFPYTQGMHSETPAVDA